MSEIAWSLQECYSPKLTKVYGNQILAEEFIQRDIFDPVSHLIRKGTNFTAPLSSYNDSLFFPLLASSPNIFTTLSNEHFEKGKKVCDSEDKFGIILQDDDSLNKIVIRIVKEPAKGAIYIEKIKYISFDRTNPNRSRLGGCQRLTTFQKHRPRNPMYTELYLEAIDSDGYPLTPGVDSLPFVNEESYNPKSINSMLELYDDPFYFILNEEIEGATYLLKKFATL